MQKTVLITGATDGIGLKTAEILAEKGHNILLHGRNPKKLEKVKTELTSSGAIETYIADLSDLNAVRSLAQSIKDKHNSLDVIINNAGVLKTPNAITMWTIHMAQSLGNNGPVIVAVNPGSLLASKMIKEGFDIPGKDISIGADIFIKAAFSEDFSDASGKYFDNDSGQFAPPHPAGQDTQKCEAVVNAIEKLIA